MKMIFNFEKKIDNIITLKQEQIEAQANAKITEAFQFDILKRQFIEKLWQNRESNENSYVIYISEEKLENINFSTALSSKVFIEKMKNILQNNNIVEIGGNLEAIHFKQSSNGIGEYCYSLSKCNNVAFLLSKNGIKILINGEIALENSLFVDEQDYIEYSNKKDITEINEIFKEYQEELNKEGLNLDIFLQDHSSIKSISGNSIYKNVLRSDHQKYMKNHLRDFLSKNIRRTFNINYVLTHSKRQIDIYTEDIDFYFITIKWMGVSVSECGTRLNPPKTDYDIRCGVTETLDYIKELRELEGFSEQTLKKGFLVVFDAREENESVQYNNYEFVDKELKKYVKHFQAITEFKLDKKISA